MVSNEKHGVKEGTLRTHLELPWVRVLANASGHGVVHGPPLVHLFRVNPILWVEVLHLQRKREEDVYAT
jgi:hypothetical protein